MDVSLKHKSEIVVKLPKACLYIDENTMAFGMSQFEGQTSTLKKKISKENKPTPEKERIRKNFYSHLISDQANRCSEIEAHGFLWVSQASNFR